MSALLLRYFRFLSLYPQINPQSSERSSVFSRASFRIFFFLFRHLGPVHTPWGPPGAGAGGWRSRWTGSERLRSVRPNQ